MKEFISNYGPTMAAILLAGIAAGTGIVITNYVLDNRVSSLERSRTAQIEIMLENKCDICALKAINQCKFAQNQPLN